MSQNVPPRPGLSQVFIDSLSSCLQLANDFISRTQSESIIIDFENKYCFNKSKDGERLIGRGYFKGFKKINVHRIISRRGQKY